MFEPPANTLEKRPRHYADEITCIYSRESRRAALAEVPEHLRALTAEHVKKYFLRKRHGKIPKPAGLPAR